MLPLHLRYTSSLRVEECAGALKTRCGLWYESDSGMEYALDPRRTYGIFRPGRATYD